MKNDFRCITT